MQYWSIKQITKLKERNAAIIAENKKIKNIKTCETHKKQFLPYGYWTDKVEEFLNQCAKMTAERTLANISVIKNRFTVLLSTTLQKANASMRCQNIERNFSKANNTKRTDEYHNSKPVL